MSCRIYEIMPTQRGWRRVWFTVAYEKGDIQYESLGRMSVVQDGGRLLIADQEASLSWSNDDEKRFAERVRAALLKLAPSGTYLLNERVAAPKCGAN